MAARGGGTTGEGHTHPVHVTRYIESHHPPALIHPRTQSPHHARQAPNASQATDASMVDFLFGVSKATQRNA